MSHLSLDARAILEYLNELGYRNISAEQLKEFMKDLRKLIKYEERLGSNANQDDYFESLFRRTTASYRAKVDKENVNKAKNSIEEGAQGNSMGKSKKTLSGNPSVVSATRAKANAPLGIQESTLRKNRSSSSNVDSKHSELQHSKIKVLSEGNRVQSKEVFQKKSQGSHGELSFDDIYKSNKEETSSKRHNRNKGKDENILDFPIKVQTGKGARPKERIQRETQRSAPATGILRKVSNDIHTPHWERQSSPSWGPSSDRGMERPGSYCSSGTIIPLPRKKTRADRSGINDPVKLYHWYQNEWKHFKKQIPTENTRADLRWQIRQKLLDPQ